MTLVPQPVIESMLAALDTANPAPDKLLLAPGWQAPKANIAAEFPSDTLPGLIRPFFSTTGRPLADHEQQQCLRGKTGEAHVTILDQAQFCGVMPPGRHR